MGKEAFIKKISEYINIQDIDIKFRNKNNKLEAWLYKKNDLGLKKSVVVGYNIGNLYYKTLKNARKNCSKGNTIIRVRKVKQYRTGLLVTQEDINSPFLKEYLLCL